MKAVIFDFDGVIHDTFELAYKINKQLDGLKSEDEYKDFFNGNLFTHKAVKNADHEAFYALQEEAFKGLVIEEEIKAELIAMAEKWPLFIITSNKEETLATYFQDNGILHIFTDVLGYETHTSKEEKFKMLFEKYSVTPKDCIFVTDTLGDLLEGQAVGVPCIAVDFGFHERERLEKGNPQHIVSHFSDILPLLKENV